MMKLSVYAGKVADGTLQGTIQYCKDFELERVLVPLDLPSHPDLIPGYKEKGYVDVKDLTKIKQEIEDAGLSWSAVHLWPSLIVGAPETEGRFNDLCKSMDAMGQVGANVLTTFVNVDPSVSPGDEEARWDLLVGFYRQLMAHAEKCEVKIALHTGGSLWTYEGVTRIMRDVPSPYNGVCFCTGYSWRIAGEGIYDMIRRLGEKVFHVHLRNVRIVPGDPHDAEVWFGSGQPDLSKVVQALRDIDYHGDMHAEHLPGVVGERDEEIRTAFAVGYMRAVLQ
jgi:sugar phosphate isomerase/epimerase